MSWSAIFAQDSSNFKKINICDIYISTGINAMLDQYGSLADFKTIAPQSLLLNNSFAGFSTNSGISMSGNLQFSAKLGINFINKNKTHVKENMQLQLGIMYSSFNVLSNGYYRDNRTPADTLTSSSGNQTIYLDTVVREGYNLNVFSNQLRLDAACIFRTIQALRWSLHGGIGFNVGFGLENYFLINYFKNTTVEPDYNSSSGSVSTNGLYSDFYNTYEYFNAGPSFGGSLYLPFGLDFRIGKRREFLKHLHLFIEARPSINMLVMSGVKTVIAEGLVTNFGVRYSIK